MTHENYDRWFEPAAAVEVEGARGGYCDPSNEDKEMNRDTAVRTWRDVCGSDTVMAMGVVTDRRLEEFAARIEAAERERCARLVETQDTNGDHVGGWFELLAAKIRA